MTLTVRFVSALSEIVNPVADWCNDIPSTSNLFEPSHLLVPTNGVKAWLLPELARRVGTGGSRHDGVVANIRVGYLGSLHEFIVPERHQGGDPWSIESMTGVILGVVTQDPSYAEIVKRAGGSLQAAARLADRFDRYHVRRPVMIRAWEAGSPVITPTTADSFNDGEWRAGELGDQRWQYDLWQQVRSTIGVPPWPVRIETAVHQLRRGEQIPGVPRRLMVAGMQSLSLGAIELLEAFGYNSEVEVLLVHPSPTMAARWHADVSSVGVRRGALHSRPVDEDLPDDVHPLLHSWLRGARELQQMLALQGLPVDLEAPVPKETSSTLLGRMKNAVAGNGFGPRLPRSDGDLSVQVHRCYSLTRQVEVLHDALLHAFRDIENLAPHEVVILSPRLAEVAPILEAVFDRTVRVQIDDGEREIRIPLSIAERQLGYLNSGAEFLDALLGLMTSRFDVSSFMKVASNSLVADHLRIDADDLDVWNRQIARTRVYWGLSGEQRIAAGVDLCAPDGQQSGEESEDEINSGLNDVHTWKQVVERALLGAAVPDGPSMAELGGVAPLPDIGTEDLDALTKLVHLFDIIVRLEGLSRGAVRRDVRFWCDSLEQTVRDLCGDADAASGAYELLSDLRSVTLLQRPDGEWKTSGAEVPFAEVAQYLLTQISGVPGRQPLRTGAVTATSLMPLRGVPYRVVCLLGIDDGVFNAPELESDDLIGRQVLIGDDDSRIDGRRQLLDSVLAADERVIITCDGRSIQSNSKIPLTTPLSELIDFARGHGVADRAGEEGTDIEFLHPRHSTSTRNFTIGGVIPGLIWGHSVAARDVAVKVGSARGAKYRSSVMPSKVATGVIELDALARFVKSPLRMYVNDVLGARRWRDEIQPDKATLPLTLDKATRRRLIESYLKGATGLISGWSLQSYMKLARITGDLPIGEYAKTALAEVEALAESIMKTAEEYSISKKEPEATPISLPLDGGFLLNGSIPRLQHAEKLLGVIKTTSKYEADHVVSALHLLAAMATGLEVRHAITIHSHEKEPRAMTRLIYLKKEIDEDVAASRLGQLTRLRVRAMSCPMPAFGDTVKSLFPPSGAPDIEKGRKAFDKYLEKKNFSGSLEHAVYGDLPSFDEIFDQNGPVFRFWSDFNAVFRLVKSVATEIPGKLPDGRSQWKVV